MGKISILIAMLIVYSFGCSNSSNNDCRKGHLMAVESCKQKSGPGFQNSGAYYVIAKGVPRGEFCSSFVNQTQALDSDVGKSCKDWKESKCDFPGMDNGKCFECDRDATNGNTHYYLLATVSPDCKKGVFFSGSQYTPSDFKEEIGIK